LRVLAPNAPRADIWGCIYLCSPGALMNFEKSLQRLDEIMAALEGEQVGLDASLKLFEEGIELLRSASIELDKAETRVQMLIERSAGGFELREMDL
jgi:exodeoxyribonuclease VII small subunit